MSYQSFDKKGDSNSLGKWNALSIDNQHLNGKKVLDIGCNEGFFCLKCIECGAKESIGIDRAALFIDKANERKGDLDSVTYILSDWTKLLTHFEPESFDVILLLSSMHYASYPENILPDGTNIIMNDIHKLLRKGGLFVFEGGIVMSEKEEWAQINRHVGDVIYHPTQKQFEKSAGILFENVKLIGRSVNQGGDQIDRYVYHSYK